MEIPAAPCALDATQAAVLRTLVYFDLFHHPLRFTELMRFLDRPIDATEVRDALEELLDTNVVFEMSGHYALRKDEDLILRKTEDETRARSVLQKAMRVSKLMGAFPFVRGISISGSLSKGRSGADSDVDYFVITAPGRLWLARTLLMLYKKVVLFNNRKYFCANYFIDTEHLSIEDRNRFTATELVSLIPTYDAGHTARFFTENKWAFNEFPQARIPACPLSANTSVFKTGMERSLSSKLGDLLERACMRMTMRRWRKRWGHMPKQDFEIAFRSRAYVSKHHPNHFQERVMRAFVENLERVGTRLTKEPFPA